MLCIICKHGHTRQGTSTVTLEKEATTIVFKHVPALVCENCGETYFEEKVTQELLKKAKEIHQSGAIVDVRDYTLTAA